MDFSCQSNQESECHTSLDILNTEASFSGNHHPFSLSSTFQVEKPGLDKPTSLLEIDIQGQRFYISQSAQNCLESLKGECYVISVSGNPLAGKSSLSNLLLSFFKLGASQEEISYQDRYLVGDDVSSTTIGIDMFCLTIDKKNFIFLDVEGAHDPKRGQTGVWIYSNLIQTVASVSHVHIHSYFKTPENAFFDYFQTIDQIVQQNNIHPDFKTRYEFLRRDFSTKNLSAEKLKMLKTSIDERFIQKDLDTSFHSLPLPPEHITDKCSAESCIKQTKSLCKDCQGHEFTTTLMGFYRDLKVHLSKVTPFRNGQHVAQILEQLVKINKREVPFFLDRGDILEIRMKKIEKERIRILETLCKLERYERENSSSPDLHESVKDYPSFFDAQASRNFNNTQSLLTETISKWTFLIPELSQFIDQYLLDNRASILDEGEKHALCSAYVNQFLDVTTKSFVYLKDYDKIIQLFCKSVLKCLKTSPGTLKKLLDVMLKAGISGGAGFLAKKLVAKVIAGLCVGGGVAAAFTVEHLYKTYGEFQEAKRRTEELVKGFVEELKRIRRTLAFLSSEEMKKKNLDLLGKISKAMDKKIAGENLSEDDCTQLLRGIKVAENNLRLLKSCI